jgi:endonuclease YncB( thermonuclease family)
LSINRPRRIFRSWFPRFELRGLVLPLGIGLIAAAAGVSLAMLPHSETPAPVAPAAEELKALPAQVAVVDGATLRLRDRVVLLQGVEPPRRGRACGANDDCGAAATNALAAMVRDSAVSCRVTGSDSIGRPYAICLASGTELNQAVIAAGWARASLARPELKQAESTARTEHRGVWAANESW